MSPRTSEQASSLRIEERWPGVHLVWHTAEPLKSVIVEFDTYVAVVEIPVDAPTVQAMLDELGRRFPSKPVRYAVHTHHHGHSVGALDPLFAAGTTFVTTAWNLEQLRSLASDSTGLERHVKTFDGAFELAEGRQRLVAHLLRRPTYPVPSEEYVVIELPAARAAISGCLYNKPLTYHEVINGRKRAIDRFLTEHADATEWLVPTNTSAADGFEDVCSRAMLRDTLRLGLDPAVVAEELRRRPPAQLEATFAELVAQFRRKTPRGYDLLVCGNYLRDTFADDARALVLFRIAVELSPEDIGTHWAVSEAALALGRTAEARTALERALPLASNDADRAEIEAKLAELPAP